jgi:ABC-type microcin C transport system duplicated ATPase subunit YejF
MPLKPDRHAIRGIRGREIALVFEEPMNSFSPIHTVGRQVIETIRLHQALDKTAARRKAIDHSPTCAKYAGNCLIEYTGEFTRYPAAR